MSSIKSLWGSVALLVLIICPLATPYASAQDSITPWSEPHDIVSLSDVDTGAFGVLLCDQYQNTHLLWSNMSEMGSALYYQSDTMGDWSIPQDVVAMADRALIRLSADISNKTDTIHVIWQNRYIGGDVYYSQVPLEFAMDPRAWNTPSLLSVSTDSANIFVDAFGVVHVVYGISNNDGRENVIYYLYSESDGMTWSQPISIFQTISQLPSTISAAIAVDTQGNRHVGVTLRSQDYGVYSEVGYLRATDSGQNWNYEQIQVLGSTFQGVSTIRPYVFNDNEIHLTWHDPRRMHQWSRDGGETWSAPVEIMPLGAAFGGPNALVKDSAGTIHVVLATGGGVYSVGWDRQAWGTPERIDNRSIDPHGQAIAICQGNQLHVTYYDRTGDNRVWYSTRTVAVPPIPRQPIPRSVLESLFQEDPPLSPTPSDEEILVSSNFDMANIVSLTEDKGTAMCTTITPVLVGTGASLLLIALVFLLHRH